MIDFDIDANPVKLAASKAIPAQVLCEPTARIKILGVGGAGGNTVNYMRNAQYDKHVEFLVVNTDIQALALSQATTLQIGVKSTKGLGSGANPELGKKAAEEDLIKVLELVEGADIVFLTGGLGGGTGSGAMPVIARALKEQNILTIAVVTKPFQFEGRRRMNIAQQALEQLKNEVDTLIVVPNQKLLDVADSQVSLIGAFDMVNGVVNQLVKSIADIIARPGHINVDFADVKAIMKNMGLAVMGTGSSSGADRAQYAALNAISSPLLENMSIKGARSILINITGDASLGLHELNAAASLISEQVHEDATIIIGSVIDAAAGDHIHVTVIATGFAPEVEQMRRPQHTAQLAAHAPELMGSKVVDQNDLEMPTLLRRMLQEKQNIYKN